MGQKIPKKHPIDLIGSQTDLLIEINSIATKIGIHRVAIVGGLVRDNLISHSKQKEYSYPKDIDLIIEGGEDSITSLAKALEENMGSERIQDIHIYNAFRTLDMKIDGISVDIATARKEIYLEPGANPIITPSIIEDDLKRRDFTVNSIALELPGSEPNDPFNGRNDLAKKELSLLHDKSIEDDPTRIIRAARYSARLDFTLNGKTLDQIKSTLIKWPWKWFHGDRLSLCPPALSTRLRLELELLFSEESFELALERLQSWGGFNLFDRNLQNDYNWKLRLKWASRLNLSLLTAFLAGSRDAMMIAKRLQIPLKQQELLLESNEVQRILSEITFEEKFNEWAPSRWTNEIESRFWEEDSVALAICNDSIFSGQLFSWYDKWRHVKSPISANDLIKNGLEPGPKLGEALKSLRLDEMDKKYFNS